MSTDDNTIRQQLGLTPEMHTYFLRAPAEYWQVLGKKPQPYDDNVGEYEFIHAFFTDSFEMSNFADILESKLAVDGILWVSWPNMSDASDITEQTVRDVFMALGLTNTHSSISIANKWFGLKFTRGV
jgi:hypothetical protein